MLVEGPSKKDAGVLAGRTRQGKLVHFSADESVTEGDFAQVRIGRAAPHHLSGTLVSLERHGRGARRASIPLSVG